jgi:hypothetical protein
MHPEQAQRLLYLTALNDATGFFEAEIRAHIPAGITVRDRAGKKIVDLKPGDRGYEEIHERFTREVSSPTAIHLLQWLYKIEMCALTFEAFLDRYRRWIRADRIRRIQAAYPQIDQTTVIGICRLKKSSAANRLEDLAKIDLVTRTDLGPPDRTYVGITPTGMTVVESASRKGMASLAPVFTRPALAAEP